MSDYTPEYPYMCPNCSHEDTVSEPAPERFCSECGGRMVYQK